MVHDPKAPRPFVPAAHRTRDAADQSVYFWRHPSVADRAKFRHALAAAGGRQHTEIDMLEALADGVRAILTDADDVQQRAALLEIIAGQRERVERFYEAVRAGELNEPGALMAAYAAAFRAVPELDGIELTIAEHYPRYATMCADRIAYGLRRGLVAARHFMVGWENVPGPDGAPLPFRRRPDGTVPDSLLDHIPSAHLAEFGGVVEGALEPGPAKGKGSPSP